MGVSFADSLSRLTYFLCFTIAGIMEVWIFLILLYRDLSVSFIRLIMARKGTIMSARISGKVKAWVYAISGFVGLGILTFYELSLPDQIIRIAEVATYICFAVSAATALWTLGDYASVLLPKRKNKAQTSGDVE